MIQIEISGVHYELNPKITKYAERKIGRLDRYLPNQHRSPANGHVILTEEDGNARNRFTCEVNLTFPHGVVTAKESTINIFAAVDIVEAKIRQQLTRAKGKMDARGSGRDRRILRRLRRFGR